MSSLSTSTPSCLTAPGGLLVDRIRSREDLSISGGPTGDPSITLSQTNPNGPTGTAITLTADNLNLDITNSIQFSAPIYAPAFVTKTGSVTIPVGPSITPIGVTFTSADSGVWIFSVKVPQPTGAPLSYVSLWTVLDLGAGNAPGVGPLNTTDTSFSFFQEGLVGTVLTAGAIAELPLPTFVGAYEPVSIPAQAVEVLSGYPFEVNPDGSRTYALSPFYDEGAYLNPIEMSILSNSGTTLNWSLTKLSAF